MTDNISTRLIAELQDETTKKDVTNKISLSYGTIIVLTANNIKNLRAQLLTPLIRAGRIDKKYIFTELFVPNK